MAGGVHRATHQLVPLAPLQSTALGERSGSIAAPMAPSSTGVGGCTLTTMEMDLVLRRLRRIVGEVGAECMRRSNGQQALPHAASNDITDDEENHKMLLIRTLYECDAFDGTEVGRHLEQIRDGTDGVELLRSYAERKGWYTRTIIK